MNTSRFFTLLVVLIVGAIQLSAQSWERIYPGLKPDSIAEFKKTLPTPDGGFLMLAGNGLFGAKEYDIHLLKINGAGITEWVRHYDFGDLELPQDIIATSDGGYAIVYEIPTQQNEFLTFVLKLDATYNMEFRHAVDPDGPAENLRGKQIIERQQQLYVFGTVLVGDLGINTGFLYGIDLQGNALGDFWELYPGESELQSVTLASDNHFVVALNGRDLFSGGYAIVIAKLDDQNSTMLWEKVVNYPDSVYQAGEIRTTPDGGYLVSGSKNSHGLVFKLDAGGNIIWQTEFPWSNNPDALQVLHFDQLTLTASGDGFFATGSTPLYIPQIALARFDLQGNLLWHKTLGIFFNYNYARDIVATNDGGCLLAGTRSIQPNSTNWVPYAIRTDNAGNGFLSGISGAVELDQDNDCIGDADSALYGFGVLVWQNGALVSSGTVGQSDAYAIGLDTGNYQITVQKPNNAWSFCPDTIVVAVPFQDSVHNVDFTAAFNPAPVDSIYGYVFEDTDGDCIRDSFETVYPGWAVVAILQGQNITHTFTGVTDANGYFSFTALTGFDNTATGYFSIAPPPGDGLNCTVSCPQAFNIRFINSNSFEANFGVHCDSLPPCPIIEVDIATTVLRPCFPSTYNVYYCNNGSVLAENTTIEVTVDPALSVTGASIPWSAVSGNVYTFPTGNLTPEQCGNFSLTVETPCDDPLGTTYCVEAHAYPDTICAPAGVNWDGSQIEVNASCTGDSVVFTIRNVGVEDMAQPLEYIVIEDNVMLMQSPGQFQLDAGDEVTRSFPATGVFYRMEADQSPGYPGAGTPAAWAEGCGGAGSNISLGFVNQHYLPDDEPWLDIFCLESVNSFDPNDKNGFPRGYKSEHLINANTDIEYLIRFQNTGTAEAINIEIRDTIPVHFLDPSTVRPGASSHPYIWDMQGSGVVSFRFPGINLPDSSASQELSQGFVKFRVSQRPDLAAGVKIRNTAAIYFDFNDPIITNQTLHTIGKDFITVETHQAISPDIRVKVSPNPMNHRVLLQIDGLKENNNLDFRLLNTLGQTALKDKFSGNAFWFDSRSLPAGVYYYELRNGQQIIAQGKLIRQE